MSTTPNNCPCPPGYIPDPSGTTCVQVSTSTPTQGSTTYAVVAGAQSVNYGNLGANFYEDITVKSFPIIFSASPSRLTDANGIDLTVNNTVSNPLWGDASYTPPPYHGRLNNCGVWTNVVDPNFPLQYLPQNEWIGFSFCLDVPITDTYCIGIAADNAVRFKLNGQTVAELYSTGVGYSWMFNKWHVLPITLQAGTNIIEFEGLNLEQIASFGAEVYHATPAQLASVTSPAALSAYTKFTTGNKIGQTFQTGQFSGYVCPDGCALNLCNPSGPICSCYSIIPKDTCCFRLLNCITQAVIITSTDLSANIGQTVVISGQSGCWQVSSAVDCVGAVAVVITASYASCDLCVPCFLLRNCQNELQTIATDVNLSSYLGQVVQIVDYPDICWTVSTSSNCRQAAVVQISKAFSNCTACTKKCFMLTDCSGEEPPIITDTDLGVYVGEVVQIKDCGDRCWTVNLSDSCVGAVAVQVMKSFRTCDTCNPPLVCPAPELLHQRKVKPGYNTPGCSPEYTEKVNCEFAEQIYNQVKKRRYGISVCCEDDYQKWFIKKQLLDLRAIYDPNLCKTVCPVTCPTDCPPCPVPDAPVPPISVLCPSPSNLTAVITINDVCPVEGGDATAQITFNKQSTRGL